MVRFIFLFFLNIALLASARSDLTLLDQMVSTHGRDVSLLSDVRAIFKAQELEGRGLGRQAEVWWFDALNGPDEHIALEALWLWGRRVTARVGNESSAASLILKASLFKKMPPWMFVKKLHEPEHLASFLRSPSAQGWRLEKIQFIAKDDYEKIWAKEMPAKGIPASDPMLFKASLHMCNQTKQYLVPEGVTFSMEQRWLHTLPKGVALYWKGLCAACRGDSLEAINYLKDSLPGLSSASELQPQWVGALSVLGPLMRRNGLRMQAKDMYLALVDVWRVGTHLTYLHLGLSVEEPLLQRVDHTLWAARLQTLAGDVSAAKALVMEALLKIKGWDTRVSDKKTQDKFMQLEAEALYILSMQIGPLEKQWDHVEKYATQGLVIKNISKEWVQKFLWLQGLAFYFQNRFTESALVWQDLLLSQTQEEEKAKTLFWLARALYRTKNLVHAEETLKHLLNQYPLSFYAVVAPHMTPEVGPYASDWRQSFKKPQALLKKLMMPSSDVWRQESTALLSLEKYSEHGFLFAKRTKILTMLHLQPWARLSGLTFKEKLKKIDAHVLQQHSAILSAWLYRSGNPVACMNTLSDYKPLGGLDAAYWRRYPEMLFCLYPLAFAPVYKDVSQALSVASSLLWGVSRQESGFRAEIISPAGAVGLMQLIPPTAQRFASGIEGFYDGDRRVIAERLKTPAYNVRLGGVYLHDLLSRFQNNEIASIAAYNAGEYAVEQWLKLHHFTDLLTWIELIPFGETREYVKIVLKNKLIYKHLEAALPAVLGLGDAPVSRYQAM